ncbi:DUF1428 domain-containing protein [Rhodovulum strictum]|uniref:DUF1428 family protein n=1 Tax=Rhodovulum strictum TaxID=58314 RepID=A0A844BGR8_9RHOB|nr:DUF1428 domain-containing protein [Rhodovulum strictum]MRH20615.1 DUF1428 family protein [Rhodovulum strictum]
MTCITSFIAAVPTANRDAFIRHAALAAEAFHDHGLASALEGWGEDMQAGDGPSFHGSVLATADETVVFSFYRWPDTATQDAAMRTAMADPRIDPATNPMPFDGKRVIWGHFEPVLELGAPQPGGFFDGFVIPVPRTARAEFEAFGRFCDPIFMEHGAVWIAECWETHVPDGKLTDFRRAVAARPDEAIVFSWVQWPDRAARDAGNARIYADPRFDARTCPFDMTRMIVGGFVPVVQT